MHNLKVFDILIAYTRIRFRNCFCENSHSYVERTGLKTATLGMGGASILTILPNYNCWHFHDIQSQIWLLVFPVFVVLFCLFFFSSPVYENTKKSIPFFNIRPWYIWIKVLAFWTVLHDILVRLLIYPIESSLLLILKQKKRNLQWFWTTSDQNACLQLSFTTNTNKIFRTDKKLISKTFQRFRRVNWSELKTQNVTRALPLVRQSCANIWYQGMIPIQAPCSSLKKTQSLMINTIV